MASHHSEAWLKHRQFGIVIDAGSSGSRIHIYSWLNKDHLTKTASSKDFVGALPTIEPGVEAGTEHADEWTKKTEPGIADYKDRPEDVSEHLEPLLDHALGIIPKEEIPRTPIYLMATAGLRLVQEDVRLQILANSCKYIRDNYDFSMGECKDHIQNISGEEEGLYGWVAINYLMGGFDNGGVKMINPAPGSTPDQHHDLNGLESSKVDSSTEPIDGSVSITKDDMAAGRGGEVDTATHRHTLGFLDMGGASTQIAFEPAPKAALEHANDLTTVHLQTLDGQTLEYHVFVTTFLGYGSNQARRRYVEDFLLIEHKSVLEKATAPGVQIQIEDPCLPRNLQLSETHSQPNVQLTGKGSFAECLKRVEVLLNKDVVCDDDPCLINGVHTPPIDFNINTFIGVSEYWYSSHDVLGLGGAYDYAEFERKSAEFCNSEWDDIRDRPEFQGQTLDRLEMQCFKSAWLSNVLHSGFGVPRFGEHGALGSKKQEDEVLEKAEESLQSKNWRPPFQSINAIKDIQVTWTLGAMLIISSGSMGPMGGGIAGGHSLAPVPMPESSLPANHAPPYEDTYPERMLDNYNHYMLLAIVLFGLAIFWVYRSRTSKPWPTIRRWLGGFGRSVRRSNDDDNGSSFLGRFTRSNGASNSDYSSLESGTVNNQRNSSPRASLKEVYLSVVHHTRSVWWSVTSRIWPEPRSFEEVNGAPGEMMESIAIAGFDGHMATTTLPGSNVGGGGNGGALGGNGGVSHHGGTPAGNLGSLGLSSIPELGGNGNGSGGNGYESPATGYFRSHSSHSATRPPKTSTSNFFRINKKRFSGDSQSLFKEPRVGTPLDGCVVNTALLPLTPKGSSVELTARTGSSTNLSSLNNNINNLTINSSLAAGQGGAGSATAGSPYHLGYNLPTPGSATLSGFYHHHNVSGSTTPSGMYDPQHHHHQQHQGLYLSRSAGASSTSLGGGSVSAGSPSWRQGWIPEDDSDESSGAR